MRRFFVPAVAAALIASTSLAFAAQTAKGTVESFDAKSRILTLDTGSVYHMKKGFKNPGLKAGEQVVVTYDMKNGENMATGVKIQK